MKEDMNMPELTIDDLSHENMLMRARNERLEKELAEARNAALEEADAALSQLYAPTDSWVSFGGSGRSMGIDAARAAIRALKSTKESA